MGRRPIGKVAMTDVERQRKRRETLAAKAAANWKPGYRRGWSNRWMTEERFNDLLGEFLEYGNADDVARFLADHDGGDVGRWDRIAARVTVLIAEAEAIAEAGAREAEQGAYRDK